jgi:hypothetical protein
MLVAFLNHRGLWTEQKHGIVYPTLFHSGRVIFYQRDVWEVSRTAEDMTLESWIIADQQESTDHNLGLSLPSEVGEALWVWALKLPDLTQPPGKLSELNWIRRYPIGADYRIDGLVCLWKTLTHAVSVVKCWVCEHKSRKTTFGFSNLWWNPDIPFLRLFCKD